MKAIEAAGLSFILGMKIPGIAYVIDAWRREHPGEEIPDGHVFTGPGRRAERQAPRPGHLLPVPRRPGPADAARHRRAGRQGRKAVAGLAPVKRNRFSQLEDAVKNVNLHRGPPDDRVRRPRRQQVDRYADRLVDQEFVKTARRYREIRSRPTGTR